MQNFSFAMGMLAAGALAALIKYLITAPVRRFVRHRMRDGLLRQMFLQPIGYTDKARKEAEMKAVMDDYHLILPSRKLR